jgi:hypothetical protein
MVDLSNSSSRKRRVLVLGMIPNDNGVETKTTSHLETGKGVVFEGPYILFLFLGVLEAIGDFFPLLNWLLL